MLQLERVDNRRVAPGHYENFPVASILCPPRLRQPIRGIYAFARTADDIADEGVASESQRREALSRYRQVLRRVAAPGSNEGLGLAPDEWPEVFRQLADVLHRFELPVPLLEDLLDAFAQDSGNPAYSSRGQLLDYCRRSANPIGRLLLHLYGIDDQQSIDASDAICTALQLINFWQDLSVDLPRGRCYLPMDDCKHFAVQAESLASQEAASRSLVRNLVGWSAEIMARGAGLPLRVPGRAGWELRLVVHGGWRILEKIRDMGFRSFLQRPRLTALDAPTLLWRGLHYAPEQFQPDTLR